MDYFTLFLDDGNVAVQLDEDYNVRFEWSAIEKFCANNPPQIGELATCFAHVLLAARRNNTILKSDISISSVFPERKNELIDDSEWW